MEDKDYIKNLFKDKLANQTEKVNPKVWAGVQSQISAITTTTSIGLSTKIIVTTLTVAALATGIYFVSKPTVKQESTKKAQNSIPNEIESEENSKEISLNTTQEETEIENNATQNSKEKTEIKKEVLTPFLENIPHSITTTINDANLRGNEKELTTKDSHSTASTVVNNTIDADNKTDEKNEEKVLPNYGIIIKEEGVVYNFSIDTEEFDFIEWDFGDGNYSTERTINHVYDSAGKYLVKARVVKGNKQKTVEKTVGKDVSGRIVKLPNSLTLNNDGLNDVFFLETENLVDFQITILNKNNELIFKSNKTDFKWYGTNLKGEVVEKGSYVYIITATDTAGNSINKYKMLEIKN